MNDSSVKELKSSLKLILRIIDGEEQKVLKGKKPNWRRATQMCREEALYSLSVVKEWEEISHELAAK